VDVVLRVQWAIFNDPAALEPYYQPAGLQRVTFAASGAGLMPGEEALNVVFGIIHRSNEPTPPPAHRGPFTTNAWPRC